MAEDNNIAVPDKVQQGVRNKHYWRGIRIKVPRDTKRVYIPRRKHYAPSVLTEEGNYHQLERFYDQLEPCVVERGVNGWQLHRCQYHLVYVEEK